MIMAKHNHKRSGVSVWRRPLGALVGAGALPHGDRAGRHVGRGRLVGAGEQGQRGAPRHDHVPQEVQPHRYCRQAPRACSVC